MSGRRGATAVAAAATAVLAAALLAASPAAPRAVAHATQRPQLAVTQTATPDPEPAGTGTLSPAPAGTQAPEPGAAQAAVPLLAFYYMWFDPSSWNRAKIDYPQLGRYSSDDPKVLRQHIVWAKAAGIEGFIVSWKDTATNDRRLRLLMGIAAQEHFKLAMIYQGLDFDRNPLPVDRVAADFTTFRDEYASDPVFYRMGGKPLTIWSGTWAYSHDDIAKVTGAVRDSMLVLNTEKSLDGYQRIADVTDGDAYYWSSVNPASNDNHEVKLTAMSQAIHTNHQYWIAPFAPGFDARLVGGAKAVDRNDGQTLRDEYAVALHSSPDALGLISWNEFSENSYVEPSQKYGTRYLDVLHELRGVEVPIPALAVDSSDEPNSPRQSSTGPWPVVRLVGFPAILLVGVGLLSWRRRRRPPTPTRHSRPVTAGRHRAGDGSRAQRPRREALVGRHRARRWPPEPIWRSL